MSRHASGLGGCQAASGHPVDSLDDQAAQVWVTQRVVFVGPEITMAEHGMKHSSFAECARPGDRPGGSLMVDGRQGLDVRHHLHLIVQLIREVEIFQAFGDRARVSVILTVNDPFCVLPSGRPKWENTPPSISFQAGSQSLRSVVGTVN